MKAPDLYDLRMAQQTGRVRAQSHPTLELNIWNYTEETAWAGDWDATTLQCRGLITDNDGNVVARPWPKFFNYGEPACPVTNLVKVPGHVEITDKLDGSLGIIYPVGDGTYAVATRGSFTSEQAEHATRLLQMRYRRWAPPEGVTVLVEIIYPENRIVLDYGKLDDLVYLGAVRNDNGADYDDALVAWPGPARDQYELSFNRLLDEIKNPTLGTNREGFVLAWPRSTEPAIRVKLKYAEYVQLHKVVTGLSTKVVWEALLNDNYDDLLAVVPEDWRELVVKYAQSLVEQFLNIKLDVRLFTAEVEPLPTRKNQAVAILNNERYKPFASLIFAALDGRNIDKAIWRRIEPEYKPLTKSD